MTQDPELMSLEDAAEWALEAGPGDEDWRWERARRVVVVLDKFPGIGTKRELAKRFSCTVRQVEYMAMTASHFPLEERYKENTWQWHKACILVANANDMAAGEVAALCNIYSAAKVRALDLLAARAGRTFQWVLAEYGPMTMKEITSAYITPDMEECPHCKQMHVCMKGKKDANDTSKAE